jgi:hypothetical protein
MKTIGKISLVLLGVAGIFLVVVLSDNQEILFESQESKNIKGDPVFNKVKWFHFKDRDVWMMNQSHAGVNATTEKWDRLAIVVETTKSPRTARFYQLESGSLAWPTKLKEMPYKVSCFICHTNGPRAIRPNFESTFKSVSFFDRIKIVAWNLRIKSYGRVILDPEHDLMDAQLERPLRFRGAFENESLKLATCSKCHKESGILARGPLFRQNLPTLKFMIESGYMPPLGFKLQEDEMAELKKFMLGF